MGRDLQNGVVMRSVALLCLLAVVAAVYADDHANQAVMSGHDPKNDALSLSVAPVVDEQQSSSISVGAATINQYQNKPVVQMEVATPPGLTLKNTPTTQPSAAAAIGRSLSFLDADFYNYSSFQSGVVRIMVPGKVSPFASLARESTSEVADKSHIGAGAGAMWQMSRSVNFGTEVILFPASTELSADPLKNANMKMLTRIELKF